MRTGHRDFSPLQLNITVDVRCFWKILAQHGVDGWNRWLEAMQDGYIPLGWEEHQPVPPIDWSFNFEGGDFSGRNLETANLKLAWLRNAGFDHAHLALSRLGTCPAATFRGADLRGADLECSDISGCDFTDAQVEGIKLHRASYDPRCPPMGLDDLLRLCRPEPDDDPVGSGAAEIPVPIIASLTSLRMPE